MSLDNPQQYPLNVGVESGRPDAATSTEIAAKIDELMRQQGVNEEANPMAAEKIRRDIEYQRQMETFAQPEGAPPIQQTPTPELDRLEVLQQELDTVRKSEATWKTKWGQKTGEVGVMKRQLADLEARVTQMTPAINVQQITGRAPDEPVTGQDLVSLLMSQSQAFGNVINQIRQEMREAQTAPLGDALPLDMESEFVEAHPWLTDLPRNQKVRAMHDILASSGVSVTPPQPVATGQPPHTATLPVQARAPVRQVAYTEPSNRGSAAERNAIQPERQAYNEKLAKLKEALNRPGGAEEAAKIFASLGAGAVDETQIGYTHTRR